MSAGGTVPAPPRLHTYASRAASRAWPWRTSTIRSLAPVVRNDGSRAAANVCCQRQGWVAIMCDSDGVRDSCVPSDQIVDLEAANRKRLRPAKPGPPACAPGRIRTCATASGGRVETRWLRWLTPDTRASLGAMRWLGAVAVVVYGSGVYPMCTGEDRLARRFQQRGIRWMARIATIGQTAGSRGATTQRTRG